MAEEKWEWPRQVARFKGQRMITGVCTRHTVTACTHPKCATLPNYQSSDSEPENTDLDELIKKNELRPNESKDQQIERLCEELARANERKATFEAGKKKFEPTSRWRMNIEDCADPTVTEETAGTLPAGFQRLRVEETQVEESDEEDRLSALLKLQESTSGSAKSAVPKKGEATPVPHDDDDGSDDDWGNSWGPNKTTASSSSTLTVLAGAADAQVVSVPTVASSWSSTTRPKSSAKSMSKSWIRVPLASSKPTGHDDYERVWQWYGGKWHHNRKW